MKKGIVLIALLFASLHMFAHALWIEAARTGKKGQEHQVKVFYGEYSEFAPEKVDKWFSDVKEFTLWLVTPDNKKIELKATAGEDHYTAAFTPATDGVYTLLVSHEPKDLGGKTKYQFNSSATVLVGAAAKQDNLDANSNPLKFAVQNNKVSKPVVVKGLFNNAPGAYEATVFSPKGWTKQIPAGADGTITFIPEWPGTYMIEISATSKETGEHNKNAFEKVWRCATALVQIDK